MQDISRTLLLGISFGVLVVTVSYINCHLVIFNAIRTSFVSASRGI